MRRAAAVVLLLAAVSCATLRRPVDTLGAANPEEAWARLASERASFDGARAFMTVDPSEGRRFDATLAVDAAGRFALEGLSPLGTTLFGIYADGERVIFVNERDRTWWEGTFAEFGEATGLFQGLAIARPADLALLLLGIPPAGGALEGEWHVAEDGLRYRVERTGLAEVVTADGARVRFIPAVFPPVRVAIEAAGSRLEIYHHEIARGAVEIEIPAPDGTWMRGGLPRVVVDR